MHARRTRFDQNAINFSPLVLPIASWRASSEFPPCSTFPFASRNLFPGEEGKGHRALKFRGKQKESIHFFDRGKLGVFFHPSLVTELSRLRRSRLPVVLYFFLAQNPFHFKKRGRICEVFEVSIVTKHWNWCRTPFGVIAFGSIVSPLGLRRAIKNNGERKLHACQKRHLSEAFNSLTYAHKGGWQVYHCCLYHVIPREQWRNEKKSFLSATNPSSRSPFLSY